MLYSDGGSIIQWSFVAKRSVGSRIQSGQNGISELNLIMGATDPRFLLSTTLDPSGNSLTQIWDWAKRSEVGNPMTGSLRFVGSDAKTTKVFYLDSFGELITWKWDLDSSEWQEILCPLARRNLTLEEWNLYFAGEDYPSNENLICQE
jgi:hypothetical protein